MLNNLSTIDPRALYDNIQSDRIKALSEKNNLTGTDKTKFQDLLDKEIKKKQLREASQQMESIFINMMFKEMRKSINKYRLLPENPAENIFNDMLYQEYSLQIAQTRQYGLAKQIYDQYSQYI